MPEPCLICQKETATLPEGGGEPRFCSRCWETRLKQLFREEDRFHIHRTMRTAEAEKYVVFHDEFEQGDGPVGVVFAMLDRGPDHLEIHAFLTNRFDWKATVPFIYEQGVEADVAAMDVFCSILEHELSSSWRVSSFSIEVSLCAGEPLYIDSRERGSTHEPDGGGRPLPP